MVKTFSQSGFPGERHQLKSCIGFARKDNLTRKGRTISVWECMHPVFCVFGEPVAGFRFELNRMSFCHRKILSRNNAKLKSQ